MSRIWTNHVFFSSLIFPLIFLLFFCAYFGEHFSAYPPPPGLSPVFPSALFLVQINCGAVCRPKNGIRGAPPPPCRRSLGCVLSELVTLKLLRSARRCQGIALAAQPEALRSVALSQAEF